MMKPDTQFGQLAVNLCDDFLQLSPVGNDGSRKSLAMPLDAVGHDQCDDEGEDVAKTTQMQNRESTLAETRHGFELWRSITRVVCLSVNARTPDVLNMLQT